MDVEDAFTEDAINALGTNVADETEDELKNIITRIYSTNEIAVSDDDVNIGMLCFVAGRTYQHDLDAPPTLAIEMTPQTVRDFIQFLTEKGTT
jgi:hypothetical protein